MNKFVDYEPQKILDEMIKSFETATGEVLYPADERRIFLNQLLPFILSLKADINYTGLQNLLRYSDGERLDCLGDMFDVFRIQPKTATVMMQYNVLAALAFDITIPQNSRVTTDGNYIFYTDKNLIIKAGQTSALVSCTADSVGTEYNGLVAGQIANMIDVYPYISSVSNVNVSNGGGDVESDEDFRARIKLSYQQYSTAGSEKSYEFWAKTVSNNIADVKAKIDTPGKVNVFVLPKTSETAEKALLDKVSAVLSSDKHRPLTDMVTVKSAVAKNYNIILTYYISKKDGADEAVILQKAVKAIDDFKLATRKELGIAINPDLLRSLMLANGVYKIDITEPIYTKVADNEVGIATTVTCTYGGLI